MRWKVASDLRFRAAISEPETPSFCGISGDLAPSTRKSLAIAIVRFGALSTWRMWMGPLGPVSDRLPAAALETTPCEFRCSEGVYDDALLACDIVWYGVCSVLSVLLSSLAFLIRGWAKRRNNPFGVIALFLLLISSWVWGRFPWWGGLRASRYHGPSK